MTGARYEIVGAAFDLTSHIRGCRTAPQILREQGLITRMRRLANRGVTVIDGGDIVGRGHGDAAPTPKYMHELLAFSDDLMARLQQVYVAGGRPVIIGGDHAIAIPSVSAAASYLAHAQGSAAELGLIWVDAHADLETPETSGSGNIHGMAAAALLGYGADALCTLAGFRPKVKPQNMVYIGLRDTGFAERALIRAHSIPTFTASDIEKLGIDTVCEHAFAMLARNTAGFVLSFDMDVCDPLEAPGVQAPERGGLRFREARIIMEYAAAAQKLMALELVEVNPVLDRDFATVKAAIALIEVALGGTII